MNKGPNVCGDTDGKMPDGYDRDVPYKPPIEQENPKPTKYFLYGLEATVHPCTPDGYNATEKVNGWETSNRFYIEYAGQRRYFNKSDLVFKADGSVELSGIIFREI